ncbi:rifin PIR protein, putative [Plasmodium reichenowi]|uniref:Rifin PIR protein, putative n=1 Tax=Plasmodium reichenowi TaxID=5854 RepID=A0A2P9DSQ6_PLARE|nr:rifin PIR protein, putative [Plasmodium reichenowi]
MKLHFCNILLFAFLLNILLTLYQTHNKNKLYITPHHTQTNRSLCECDKQSSNYDKDADMKSVKESFDDRTAQRFEEYEERMKDKRQKRKEQRDKNIQNIIENDKREKSLAEKVEKGCLRCVCGLGGVAASVGLFGGFGIYGWKISATTAAIEGVKQASIEAGEAARIAEGIKAVISGITKELGVSTLGDKALGNYITENTYTNASIISGYIQTEYNASACMQSGLAAKKPICILVTEKSLIPGYVQGITRGEAVSYSKVIDTTVGTIVSKAEPVAGVAAKKASDEVIQRSIAVIDAKYSICQTAIIASVVAIVVIVLIMIIIYLVLRYRR